MRKYEIIVGMIDFITAGFCALLAYGGMSIYGVNNISSVLMALVIDFIFSAVCLMIPSKGKFIAIVSSLVGVSHLKIIFSLIEAILNSGMAVRRVGAATWLILGCIFLLLATNMSLLILRGTKQWLRDKDDLPRIEL